MAKWIRKPCPLCSSNTGFALDLESGGYFCHSCQSKGKLQDLKIPFDVNLNTIKSYSDRRFPKSSAKSDDKPQKIWRGLSSIKPHGLTDKYLSSRGIDFHTYHDLNLREGEVKLWNQDARCETNCFLKCTYSFLDSTGSVKAINFTRHVSGLKQKRYLGPKSQGLALLKEAPKLIIAEGLENALTIRQSMGLRGMKLGMLIAGDSGNMINYADNFYEQLKNYEFVVVRDSDPAGIKAASHFCRVFNIDEVIHTNQILDANDLYI